MNVEKKQKIFVGKVLSIKREKTITVEVARTYKHPLLGKVMRDIKKYAVHDEEEKTAMGDTVEFVTGRPVSKTKKWHLIRIVKSSVIDSKA